MQGDAILPNRLALIPQRVTGVIIGTTSIFTPHIKQGVSTIHSINTTVIARLCVDLRQWEEFDITWYNWRCEPRLSELVLIIHRGAIQTQER